MTSPLNMSSEAAPPDQSKAGEKDKEPRGSIFVKMKHMWEKRRDQRFRERHPFVPKVKEQEKTGNLKLVRCSLTETYRNRQYKIRKCLSGDTMLNSSTKTIMLVGATGSGKSTLIDGMANYMFKAKWKKHKRIKLVDLTEEEKLNAEIGQSVSQTDWITVYTVPNSVETATRYTLNIIDTPGFGDTRGKERDRMLIQQIKYLFENPHEVGIDMVNAICFVVRAPDERLTEAQQYIFSEIQSLFGRNVSDNIFIMVTFCDGSEPPVLNTIKKVGIPYTKSYSFQNSALFKPTDISGDFQKFAKMFWDIGMKSFEKFFADLNKAMAKSLTLSAEVLQERDKLTNSIECLNSNIQLLCQRLIHLNEEQKILEAFESRAKQNEKLQEELQYDINHGQLVKVQAPERTILNCSICKVTCYKDSTAITSDKFECLDEQGRCTNCKSSCNADSHVKEPFVYKLKIKKLTRSQRYERTKAQTSWQEVNLVKKQVTVMKKEILDNIIAGTQCTKRLHQIALKPTDYLTGIEFIDYVIDREDREREPCWEQRINRLEEIKEEFLKNCHMMTRTFSNWPPQENWIV